MLKTFVMEIMDLLLPPRRTDRLVRTLTLEQLHRLEGEDGLPYHDPRITALIWELKYYKTSRASLLAGEYIAEALLAAASEELGVPLLIPVPMHPNRRKVRGHNQTEVLCKAALPFCAGAVEYRPHVLKRVVDTPTQQGLPKAERVKNVLNSMVADTEVLVGRAVIVLDDVTTTGATLAEAKRALRLAGARAVHCVALARS